MVALISSTKLFDHLYLQRTSRCHYPQLTQMRKILLRVNMKKAARPDNIPGLVLKHVFFTHLTRDHYHLPKANIVLVPTKSAVCGLNDIGFVWRTFTLMKRFEKLDLQHIIDNSPASLDPYHFAFEITDSQRKSSLVPSHQSSHPLKIALSESCLWVSAQHSPASPQRSLLENITLWPWVPHTANE